MSDAADLNADPRADLSPTIARAAPLDAGLDYKVLVDEGTRLVQALSGKIWTNFNYSDPGVTILEQLCYALTELSYRAGFPLPDLLGAPGSGKVSLARQGLHEARDIMPVNPVTADDLRRLLLDREPEAGNVWLTPLPASETGGIDGLYRLDVMTQRSDCSCDAPGEAALLTRMRDCYVAHRALCEDVTACVALTPLPTYLQARVFLDRLSDPDTVLAQLLFAVGMLLAPEPKRRSLAELRAAGRTTSEIFQGPLALHGFIGDDQLTPLPRLVLVDTVLEAMVSVPGVLAVDGLTIHVHGHARRYQVGDVIDAGSDNILQLQTASRDDGLVLYCGDVVCTPSPARVRRLLDRAWAEQRRTYPLSAEYQVFYPAPAGKGMDLSQYTSVQYQFPAVYGIGAYGVPTSAGTARLAQARQLQGYLMAFDQLMADYFSQLAFMRELFSIGAGGEQTYAWQSLRHLVPPDAKELLIRHYEQGMARLVAGSDPVLARQTAVLGYMLSLYASPLTAPAPVSGQAGAQLAQQTALVRARQALLARIVAATCERGRGLDYRQDPHRHPMAGLEIRSRIELALLDSGREGDALQQTMPEQPSADAGGRGKREPLYIVEWVLLRDALAEPADETRLDPAEFNFRISAVMPKRHAHHDHHGHADADADDGDGDDHDDRDDGDDGEDSDHNDHGDELGGATGWRSQVRAILRDNTSAHIVIDDIFLGHRRMRRFLRLYDEWLHVLRNGSKGRRRDVCRRMVHFLQAARRPDAPTLLARAQLTPAAFGAEAPAAAEHAAEEAASAATPGAAHGAGKPWRRLLYGAVPPPTATAAAASERLPGTAQAARPGACGAYVAGKLDGTTAPAFAAQGFAFVLRDLSWGDPASADQFDSAEASAILQAGLALMPVQAIAPGDWPLAHESASELGARNGRRAAALAHRIGVPAGVSIWLRLDRAGASQDMQTVVDYCNAWHGAVAKIGYDPGLCLGDTAAPPALYAQLPFQQYWSSGACLLGGPGYGACLVQAAGGADALAGLAYAWHFIEADRNGATACWLAGAA